MKNNKTKSIAKIEANTVVKDLDVDDPDGHRATIYLTLEFKVAEEDKKELLAYLNDCLKYRYILNLTLEEFSKGKK